MKETTKSSRNCSSKMEVLTREEQDKIITASYCQQYGVLFRLALFAGLSIYELLGLQWQDVDPDKKQLHIQHEFCCGKNGYELCRKSSSRSVTLPSHIFKELADLQEDQLNTLYKYQLNSHSSAVASTLKGHQMVPWLMEFFFSQLLRFCKLPDYSFSILRNTFTLRAIEQGTRSECLCQLLGDPHAET